MDEILNYGVLAIQTANPNAEDRQGVHRNLQRCMEMIDLGFNGYSQLGVPIKLVAFPEFVIQGIPFESIEDYLKSTVPITIPGEEIDVFIEKAKEYDCYIVTGSLLEQDKEWPSHIFNTVCIVSPNGIETRYRKYQTWLPIECWTSPHSLRGYKDKNYFPVADLPIGKIAAGICYDFLFPEICREFIFRGAEVLVRVSGYTHPFVTDEPMNWWTTVSQVRSLENVAYGVHVNQGAGLDISPPWSWAGGTLIVDYEGRILSQVKESGEYIVYGHIDIRNLREWRANSFTHLMPVHLRTEGYTYLNDPNFPGETFEKDEVITLEKNRRLVDEIRLKRYWKQ